MRNERKIRNWCGVNAERGEVDKDSRSNAESLCKGWNLLLLLLAASIGSLL